MDARPILMNQDLSSVSSKGHIFAIDDTPENLSYLTQLLSDQGYQVRVSSNGKRALKSLLSNPPDLILLDIMMPQMNGYEVCQRLKIVRKTRDIPVIFLSALDEAMDKVKAFESGGVDYITKPFEAVEVLARIKNHLHLRSLQNELQQQKELLSSILNSSLDGVAAFESVRDEKGKIIDFKWLVANPNASRMTGMLPNALMGRNLLETCLYYQDPELFEALVHVAETGENLKREFFCEGRSPHVWLQIVAVKLGDGLAITCRDITEYKELAMALQQANQELSYLASTDSLTQIPNRRSFDRVLQREWQRCFRDSQLLALILCDLDYFKAYNDYYSHQQGDECLRQVAKALKRSIQRPGDFVARYGGEEFGIVLPNTNEEGATRVAQAIQNEVRQLKIPHARSQVRKYVTLSLGIGCVRPTTKLKPKTLFATADAALYQAKQQGRDRAVVLPLLLNA